MFDTPVTEGIFASGSEPMLWRPDLHRPQLHRRAMWAALRGAPVMPAGLLAALAAHAALHPGPAPAFWAALATVAGAVALVGAGVNYRCVEHDHRHRHGQSCFLDRHPGEFCYRASDFLDMSPTSVHTATTLIDAVRQLHASTLTAHIPTDYVKDAHRIAWTTLRALDRTRHAHHLARHTTADSDGDTEALRAEIDQLERDAHAIARHLGDAAVLAHAWARKLQHHHQRRAILAERDTLTHHTTGTGIDAARTLTEGLFAYTTAARDLLDAGPFAWEHTPASADTPAGLPGDRTHSPAHEDRGNTPRASWRGDRGSAAIELTLLTPLLIGLLVFIAVLIHRGIDARLRLQDAAHQAARAASQHPTPATAATAARSTATDTLSAAGPGCRSLSVDVATGGMRPGGTVTVTLTCTLDLTGAHLFGLPDRRLTATAVEPVDRWRSDLTSTGATP